MLFCYSVGEFKAKVTEALFFQMFFYFIFYFFDILFVLFSTNPSEKQSGSAAPAYCLWRLRLISGCFRGSCFSLFLPLFSSLAAVYIFDLAEFVFTLQLCNRSHHEPILCGPWIPKRLYYIDRCVSDSAFFFFLFFLQHQIIIWPFQVNEQLIISRHNFLSLRVIIARAINHDLNSCNCD